MYDSIINNLFDTRSIVFIFIVFAIILILYVTIIYIKPMFSSNNTISESFLNYFI